MDAYKVLKEYDREIYRKTIEFAIALCINLNLNFEKSAYIEGEVVKYTVYILNLKEG